MNDSKQPWTAEWQLPREIARGGQGVVSEVRSKASPDRRAVLKEIVERWRDNAQARLRLQHEAATLAKLHALGARVPEVYDSSANHGSSEPFILMQFIPGVRFDEWLRGSAPVDPQKAVAITRAIGETIGLCHENDIGHRDIKPSNIILGGGDVAVPYVIDFGICFDSQQTVSLTREGEMFWNEFIILPECQDLEGGDRDLRSDITALVGVFFSCLTGRPPVVLRDAEGRSPHQRHESLIRAAATSVEQGERLIWFFDTGFAFRIADRFQTMNDFTRELARFGDTAPGEPLDLFAQFDVLSQAVQLADRNAQVGNLRARYEAMLPKISEAMQREMKPLKARGGKYSASQHRLDRLQGTNKPDLDDGDLLPIQYAQAHTVSLQHYGRVAVVLLVGFAVGTQIHLYAASFTAPANESHKNDKQLKWALVAIMDEDKQEMSSTKITVVVDALKTKLAHEIRNLAKQMKPE